MDVLSSCIFLQDSLYCLLIMLMMVLKKESPTRMNSIDIPMYIDSSALMAGGRGKERSSDQSMHEVSEAMQI